MWRYFVEIGIGIIGISVTGAEQSSCGIGNAQDCRESFLFHHSILLWNSPPSRRENPVLRSSAGLGDLGNVRYGLA
jgi:hypothetical protein